MDRLMFTDRLDAGRFFARLRACRSRVTPVLARRRDPSAERLAVLAPSDVALAVARAAVDVEGE